MSRCEVQVRGEERCRCVVAEENVRAHAVYTKDGLGPYIICENHLKVARRGRLLRMRDGRRWFCNCTEQGVFLVPVL
jgi:hypothetical protein